jgi:hypothetical protein
MFRRARFADVIERQLALFVRDHADVVDEARERLEAYNRADRDEAEELYGDYVDVVDAARDALLEYRDGYAATLDAEAAEEYEAVFNRVVQVRLPSLGLELD